MMHRGAPGRQAPPTPVLTVLLAAVAVLLAACSGSSPLMPTATPESTGQPAPIRSTPSDSTPPSSAPGSPSVEQPPNQTPRSPSAAPEQDSAPASEPAITMLRPAAGATLMVPLTLSGTANTFEAALTVDALNAAGDYLCIRHLTATSGSGTRGTWQTWLAFAPTHDSGTAPVTLRAYELSARDGSMTNVTERQISLSAAHPAIVMTTPACGDVVSPGSQLAVTGSATVFEAALTVELRDSGGAVRVSRNLMTAEGGVPSAFSDLIPIPAGLPGGYYDLVALSYSAKDGSKQNEFPVQILVQ